MPTDDPNKLEQAIEQLEAERERRIQAKLEAGEAVRGNPTVVGGAESVEAWKLPTHDAEGREVLYGPEDIAYIITGVPRAERDPEYCARLDSEKGSAVIPNKPLPYQAPVEKAPPPLPKLAPQPEKPPEPRYIRAEVRERSNDPADAGEIVEGYFDVKGGILYVWDAHAVGR